MSIINIIKGGVYYALGINSDLAEERLKKACYRCVHGQETEKGFVRRCAPVSKGGCGCSLDLKARVEDEKCPNHVYANNWISEDNLRALTALQTS